MFGPTHLKSQMWEKLIYPNIFGISSLPCRDTSFILDAGDVLHCVGYSNPHPVYVVFKQFCQDLIV